MTMLSNYIGDPTPNPGEFFATRQVCCGSQSEARDVPQREDYSAEVDNILQNEWDEMLQAFDDASLMQTWSYGSVRWGEKNLSHVVLKNGGRVVAAAQALLLKVPHLPVGLAYVKWGPCWRVKGQAVNLTNFRRFIRELYRIYVVERGLLLRIFPNAVEDGTGTLREILEEAGFQRDIHGQPTRTVLVDLSYPLDTLRQSFKGTWRRNLVAAEHNGLEVISGTDEGLFQDLMKLYREMRKRKKWEEIPDARYFEQIQRDLPPPLRMMVMVCRHKGEPVASIGASTLGDTCIDLLGATGNKGLTLRGSYQLHWQMLRWLKARPFRWYDLYGIDRNTHPGTYQFKSGLGGKLGRVVDYVGAYQAGGSFLTSLSIQGVETAHAAFARLKHSLSSLE